MLRRLMQTLYFSKSSSKAPSFAWHFRSQISIHVRWKRSSRCPSPLTSSVRVSVRCRSLTTTTPGSHTCSQPISSSSRKTRHHCFTRLAFLFLSCSFVFIRALLHFTLSLIFSFDSLCVLARMMTAKFLHGEIREKGGAYGGGAKMGGGLFSFYSYRWASVSWALIFTYVFMWCLLL